MTPEKRRFTSYILAMLYSLALIVGLVVGQFAIVAVVGAVVLGLLLSLIQRASRAPGQGRERNRNRR